MSTILLCKNYLKRAKINDEEASNGRSKTYVVNLFQSKYLPNTLLASNPISNVRKFLKSLWQQVVERYLPI